MSEKVNAKQTQDEQNNDKTNDVKIEEHSLLAVISVLEKQLNQNSEIQQLSREIIISTIKKLIEDPQKIGGKIINQILSGDILIEPILSTNSFKTSILLKVDDQTYQKLIGPEKFFRQEDSVRVYEIKFFDLKELENFDFLQNNRFSQDFQIIQHIEEQKLKKTNIYMCLQKKDCELYTIKKVFIPPDINWRKLFYHNSESPQIRGAHSMNRLQHQNIVRLFAWWIECEENQKKQKQYFMYQQFEYLSCFGYKNLYEYALNYLNKLDCSIKRKITKTIILQIIDAMDYMHNQQIAHRDLKLENIILVQDNYGEIIVKINNFDWSKPYLNEDGHTQGWLMMSQQQQFRKARNLPAFYDSTEELIDLANMFLDLCQVSVRHKFKDTKNLKKDEFSDYKEEFLVIQEILNKQITNIKQLKLSKLYQNYKSSDL